MADSFDAFHEWLGIAPGEQPPNHYRLLGIELFEAKANVIDSAADRQMAHLRTFQTGPRGKLCQELLNQVSSARVTLLDPEKKAAYDLDLEKNQAAIRGEPQTETLPQSQPRVARAVALGLPAAPASAQPKPVRAAPPAPLQAAVSAPQFSSTPAHRRASRKQNPPWMAIGIGAAALGVVLVIAVIAMTSGGGDETAAVEPSVRLSNSSSDDVVEKSPAATVTDPSDVVDPLVEKKSAEDQPIEKEPVDEPKEKEPVEKEPVEKEPVEKEPVGDPPKDNDNPFEVIDDNDPPAGGDPQPAATKRTTKPPVPAAAALEKAVADIRDIFDVDAAITVEAKAKLARELLAAAKETDDDPASQYVMLRMVRDMAAFHGEYAAAEQAIGEMSERFDVDVVAMRSAAVVQALAANRPAAQRRSVAREGLRIVRECYEADQYRTAKAIITAVLRAASRLKDKQLVGDARRLNGEGEALAKQYAAVRAAFETLKTKPDDPAANATAGKYVCYVKGDWKRGLAMLIKGNDAPLKDLATREQRGVTELNEQIALADAWWKIADEQPSRTSSQLRIHAGLWYKKALPKLTGLDKLRVVKRIKQADSEADDSRDSKKPRGRTLDFVYLPTRPNWQRTGFTVQAGQTIRIQATGTITLYKADLKTNPYFTADGQSGYTKDFKGITANVGSLLLKVGQIVYQGGTDTVVTVKTSGEIELGIVETRSFSNNAGKFLVRLTVQ
ncbi:MAG: hypothetical protein IIA67_13155 [Planctomycetes bacterium]|nr:hypothetical protein [Planctomycetota bacterium]